MTASFAARLLAWFDRHRRDLPWRRTRDPWSIWVSEVMLQQTRVDVVIPKWETFIARFPTAADFAAADDDVLHQAWRGLGYYRRARLLRDGARQVVEEHGGKVPESAAALSRLAGIGTYTKGAIASIAFGEAVTAVDGNVERVLARHAAITENVKRGAGATAIARLAAERLPRDRAGDFNQALMELGALVCTPRSPRCADCPVRADCAARTRGLTGLLPALPARRKAVDVLSRAVLCARPRGRVLGVRIGPGEINEGQLTLPGPGILIDCPDADVLAHELFEAYGARIEVGECLTTVRHGITHHRIQWSVHHGTLHGRRPAGLCDAAPDDPAVPWTTAARKAFRAAGHGQIDAGG